MNSAALLERRGGGSFVSIKSPVSFEDTPEQVREQFLL